MENVIRNNLQNLFNLPHSRFCYSVQLTRDSFVWMSPYKPLKVASPVMLGYFPVAMAFGYLAYQKDFGLLSSMLFSTVIFAGSAQFAALGAIAAGPTSMWQLFLMTWLINLRHVVLSLAYLPFTRNWTLPQKLRLFPILTDENFAVLFSDESVRSDPNAAFLISLFAYLSWAFGTLVGFLFGSLLPDPHVIGLDFALPAMFIGIISLFIKNRFQMVTLFATVGSMVLFRFIFGLEGSAILLAAAVGSIFGWGAEWKRK